MPRIDVRAPGPDEPGYMRRFIAVTEIQADVVELQAALKAGGEASLQAAALRKLAGVMGRAVDLVARYATVEDGSDPHEALMELSEREWNALFGALRGDVGDSDGGDGPLSPAPSAPGSGAGPEGTPEPRPAGP